MNALLDRARAAMAGQLGEAPSGPSVGEAAEGMVRAEIQDDRLTHLHIDPKMLRQPLDDLRAHIVTAMNAALDARPGRLDTAPLLAELKAVQDQSVQEMTKISQAFGDALARAIPK